MNLYDTAKIRKVLAKDKHLICLSKNFDPNKHSLIKFTKKSK